MRLIWGMVVFIILLWIGLQLLSNYLISDIQRHFNNLGRTGIYFTMWTKKPELKAILPVCSCGHVFPSLNYDNIVQKRKDHTKCLTPVFTPTHCPNCNRKIEHVVLSDGQIDVVVE